MLEHPRERDIYSRLLWRNIACRFESELLLSCNCTSLDHRVPALARYNISLLYLRPKTMLKPFERASMIYSRIMGVC